MAASAGCAITAKLRGLSIDVTCVIPVGRGCPPGLWVGIQRAARVAGKYRQVIARLALLLIVVVLASACAGPEKLRGELRYGMDRSVDGKMVHFPPPPSPPRFAYAGELIGERNFVYEIPEKNFWQKALEFLTGLTEVGGAELELARPQSVVTDDAGRVYVTDAGHARVLVFDTVDGEAKALRYAEPGRPFLAPSGLAVAPDGTLFVADADAGFIAKIGPQGEPGESIGRGLLRRPAGLIYDASQKRLVVADTMDHTIKFFDLEGRLVMTTGGFGKALGEFNRPTHLAAWRNELYVSDTFNARIQVLDLDSGQPIREFGSRGSYVGQFSIPKGVGVDNEGNVYVVESLNDHLLVFDREGRFLLPIGGTGYGTGNFYLPAGLWVDAGNRIYVADMFNGRVVTYLYLGSDSENLD